MTQSFRAANAAQGHEAQHQQDVQRAVEAPRQSEVLAQPAEQSIGTQGRQARQQAGQLNVAARLESSRRALGQSNGRCNALVGARAGHAHAVGGLCVLAAAFGLGAAGDGAAVGLRADRLGVPQQLRNRLAFECLAQRRFIDPYTPGHLCRAQTLGQQAGALRVHLRAHDRRFCHRSVTKECGRTLLAELSSPIHQRSVRNQQWRRGQVNRPDVAVFHQARQDKAPTLDVALGVRKVVVSPNEIDHLSVALENAQRLPDALRANWEARDQLLLEHGPTRWGMWTSTLHRKETHVRIKDAIRASRNSGPLWVEIRNSEVSHSRLVTDARPQVENSQHLRIY